MRRLRRFERAAGALSFALALLSSSRQGQAFPEYPDDVKKDLGLESDPNCTLCHFTEAGGKGTAGQKFALTLQQLGVPDGVLDPSALASALEEDKDCQIDSDGDGVSDVEELEKGTDPNDGKGKPTSTCGNVVSVGPTLQTGCALSARSESSRDWGVLVAMLCAILACRVSRRRQ